MLAFLLYCTPTGHNPGALGKLSNLERLYLVSNELTGARCGWQYRAKLSVLGIIVITSQLRYHRVLIIAGNLETRGEGAAATKMHSIREFCPSGGNGLFVRIHEDPVAVSAQLCIDSPMS